MYVVDTTPESRKNRIAALDRLAALNPMRSSPVTRSPARPTLPRRYKRASVTYRTSIGCSEIRPGAVRSDDGGLSALGSQSVVVDVWIPGGITQKTELPRRTYTKSWSSFPRVENTNSRTLKVGHVPGRNGQTVHQGSGCDEGITIRARVRYVKRCASPGDIGVNRKDTG